MSGMFDFVCFGSYFFRISNLIRMLLLLLLLLLMMMTMLSRYDV